MKKLFFTGLLTMLAFFLVHAQAPLTDDLGYKGGSIKGLKKPADALNIIVMGDWGRNGENYQRNVAAGMGKAAHDLDADFVIATGDNFYPYGVQSTGDYHWISSFESVYTAQSLHVRWYPVLGNHDYISNPDAQVEYSTISSRWTMPSRYYSRTFRHAGDSILFVFLDTDPIEKENRGQAYDSVKYVKGSVAKQLAWLDARLSSSKARWKIVVGHHPVYTGGWRKDSPDTKKMHDLLEPIFEKYKVDLYIAGHEHHLEHVKAAGPTHYLVSGAASESRKTDKYPGIGTFAAGVQGFATLSIMKDSALIQFIDYRDKILHETVIKK
ncbi:MAG: acid phosphatase [Chitinophagaceae bacterium]|nr:MAG: acid phosphatase [Chitinophagaceae bacterium]